MAGKRKRKEKAARATQPSEACEHREEIEVTVFAHGEEVVRQIVLNGCSNFEQLVQFGSLSKRFYELVSTKESWRMTARNMKANGQKLTQKEANEELLLNAIDIPFDNRSINYWQLSDSEGEGEYSEGEREEYSEGDAEVECSVPRMHCPVVLLEGALLKYGSQDGLNLARKKRLEGRRPLLEKKLARRAALVAAICQRDPSIAEGDARKLLKRFKYNTSYAMVDEKAAKEAANAVVKAAKKDSFFVWGMNPEKRNSNRKPFYNKSLQEAVTMWLNDRQKAELKYGHISTWDTSRVTDMKQLFSRKAGKFDFNEDISHWDTSNVTDMHDMFCGLGKFNQPIGEWDTSNVEAMMGMFCGASSFNQPIGEWDTSGVFSMGCMFCGASSFNQPIGKWDTSGVIYMESMFSGASSFNQPLREWDTSNVENMNWMFDGTSSFKQSITVWPNQSFGLPHRG